MQDACLTQVETHDPCTSCAVDLCVHMQLNKNVMSYELFPRFVPCTKKINTPVVLDIKYWISEHARSVIFPDLRALRHADESVVPLTSTLDEAVLHELAIGPPSVNQRTT